jgi:hypothetical protein
MKTSGLPVKKVNEMIARHHSEDRPVVFKVEYVEEKCYGLYEIPASPC